MDSSGNLFGTTLSGGAHGLGAVYRLSPASGGRWKETIIYSFKGGPGDGASPHATLLQDGSGNLYSTTIQGGLKSKNCTSTAPSTGCGVVFQLTPNSNGTWSESILHFFTGGEDGGNPYGALVQDSNGSFYSTTSVGGSKNDGVAYKLSLSGSSWSETVLHDFTGNPDGTTPYAGLTFDTAGNLYGTTYGGGSSGWGIVYELSLSGSSWSEKILHSFAGRAAGDGAQTFSGVVLDGSGNVFGSTIGGGISGYGTVFELKAATGFANTILHNFNLNNIDGTLPNGILFDALGNLWGSTSGGGANGGAGTIFKMTPSGSAWAESVLFTFPGSGADGVYPNTGLFIDASGNLYGATLWGGRAGTTTGGVTFEFVP
jgi:uncharacterized repeat protein (TIGR03803 family)